MNYWGHNKSSVLPPVEVRICFECSPIAMPLILDPNAQPGVMERVAQILDDCEICSAWSGLVRSNGKLLDAVAHLKGAAGRGPSGRQRRTDRH